MRVVVIIGESHEYYVRLHASIKAAVFAEFHVCFWTYDQKIKSHWEVMSKEEFVENLSTYL